MNFCPPPSISKFVTSQGEKETVEGKLVKFEFKYTSNKIVAENSKVKKKIFHKTFK